MRYIEKNDGNGNKILVEHPDDIFDSESGQKRRNHKPTNITPIKQRNKKRKR